MSIQFKDGAILFVSGAVAMDAACCCGGGTPGCNPSLSSCPSFSFTISGSPTTFSTACGTWDPDGSYTIDYGFDNSFIWYWFGCVQVRIICGGGKWYFRIAVNGDFYVWDTELADATTSQCKPPAGTYTLTGGATLTIL